MSDMFLVFLIKNICLMSFYFAYSVLIFTHFIHKPIILVYFIILALFSLNYIFRCNKKYNKLKYLSVLGIMIVAVYLKSIAGIIWLTFPFIYMIHMIKKDEYQVYYYDFKSVFMVLIIIILALPLLALLTGVFDLFKSVSLPYALVFALSGFYLLRVSRHSKEVISSKKFVIINILVIIVAFTVCIILSSDVFLGNIIHLFDLIFGKVLLPAIQKVFYIIFYPMTRVLAKIYDKAGKNDMTQEIENKDEVEALEEVKDLLENKEFLLIFYIFTAVFFIFIVTVIILMVLSKKKKIRKEDSEVYGVKQYRSFLDDDFSISKKRNQIINSSIDQIRYCYRKFLLLCNRKNIGIFPFDSSKSICEKSSKIFINSEQELKDIKEIYRKARYSEEIIDKQDIKAIKNICKGLERKKT